MSTTTKMVQFNLRIDPQLKAAGDAALMEEGHTPTEVVRLVWQCLAKGREGVSAVFHALVEASAAAEEQVEDDGDTDVIRVIEERQRQLFVELGFDPDNLPPFPEVDYDELLYAYYDERDRERGLGKYAA